MDPTEPMAKSARPRGRPKKADAPIVPWDEVDRLLVFGEVVKDPDTERAMAFTLACSNMV